MPRVPRHNDMLRSLLRARDSALEAQLPRRDRGDVGFEAGWHNTTQMQYKRFLLYSEPKQSKTKAQRAYVSERQLRRSTGDAGRRGGTRDAVQAPHPDPGGGRPGERPGGDPDLGGHGTLCRQHARACMQQLVPLGRPQPPEACFASRQSLSCGKAAARCQAACWRVGRFMRRPPAMSQACRVSMLTASLCGTAAGLPRLLDHVPGQAGGGHRGGVYARAGKLSRPTFLVWLPCVPSPHSHLPVA